MKKNKAVIILFIFTFFVLVIPIIFKLFLDFNNSNIEKEISHIDYYGYSLTTNDTKLYKDTYDELADVLNEDIVDYEEYAKLISKLFVIDVFTLNNKASSTDIGGLEFVHNDLKDNFKENMGANLYSSVLSNISGTREQKLPVVSAVNITNIVKGKYEYYGVSYDSYVVDCSILYEVDMGYQNKITLTLIRLDNKIYVVKGK